MDVSPFRSRALVPVQSRRPSSAVFSVSSSDLAAALRTEPKTFSLTVEALPYQPGRIPYASPRNDSAPATVTETNVRLPGRNSSHGRRLVGREPPALKTKVGRWRRSVPQLCCLSQRIVTDSPGAPLARWKAQVYDVPKCAGGLTYRSSLLRSRLGSAHRSPNSRSSGTKCGPVGPTSQSMPRCS